jgi:RNA 2',3'-cyclic 3'-phosphodiesterase
VEPASTPSGTTRTFVSLALPSTAVAAIERLERLLSRRTPHVRWVGGERLHLTLAFLGDLDADARSQAEAIVTDVAAATETFALGLGGVGAFPGPDRARIVWVGCATGASETTRFQETLAHALAPVGYVQEPRGFSPHVTIGRVRGVARLGTLLDDPALQDWTTAEWTVTDVDVQASELRSEGPRYTVLRRCPFAPP